MKPIKGMKEEPYGLPIMLPAWIGLVSYAIRQNEIRQQFKKDTGHDLAMLVNRSPIARMVDEAVGLDRTLISAFADWVTVNLWGDGKDPDKKTGVAI